MTEPLANEHGANTTIRTLSTPKQKQETYQQLPLLHISKSNLSKQAIKYLSDINVSVTECAELNEAREICSGKILGLILLEDEADQDFIKNLKTKGSCNEQTPVIYISHGELKDDAKCLIKEQFIDDVLFECSTMEHDLIKAVKRLISEPLQFAVTPKSKKGEGNTPKRQRLDKTPMSARRCIANEFKSIENAELTSTDRQTVNQDQLPPSENNTYINMDTLSASTQTDPLSNGQIYPACPVITHGYDQHCMPYFQYNQYPSGSLPEYQQLQQGSVNGNKMEILTAAAEMSQALASIQASNSTQESMSSENTSCKAVANLSQIQAAFSSANANQMRFALQNAEKAINSRFQEILSEDLLPKITLSGARQLLDSALMGGMQQKSPPRKDLKSERYSTKSAKKGSRSRVTEADSIDKEQAKSSQRGRHSCTFKEEKTPTNTDDDAELHVTPLSLEERKEIHLAKERLRRERIARCWHQLRKLIPHCNPSADKASVFEMTVAYVHHCWMHHPDKIQSINKDFERFCHRTHGPPENLDEMDALVDELLTQEEQ